MTDATITLSETLYALHEVAQRRVPCPERNYWDGQRSVHAPHLSKATHERCDGTIPDPSPGATLARTVLYGREASEGEECPSCGGTGMLAPEKDCPCGTGRTGATKALPGLLVACEGCASTAFDPGDGDIVYGPSAGKHAPGCTGKVPNDDLMRLVAVGRWLSAIGFVLDTLAAVEAWTLYGEVLGILLHAGQNEVAHEQAFHDALNALTAAVCGG